MKKILVFLLMVVLCVSICSCNEDSSSVSDDTPTEITTSMQAVNCVKNGDWMTNAAVEIVMDLGFNLSKVYTPDYATCTAYQKGDGSWEVTLKGTASGYIDEYNDDYERYRFTYTVTVDKYGEVNWSSGRTVNEG
ncbi:MAG: hypothetical protein IJB24_01350 [Clostridia bacterium]|nr:hypothetical protein [Clostridia bacterium]